MNFFYKTSINSTLINNSLIRLELKFKYKVEKIKLFTFILSS